MDHIKVSAPIARAQARPVARHRGVALVAVAAVGVGLAIKYQANALKTNELAQKNSAAHNLYVSVERSGGGI